MLFDITKLSDKFDALTEFIPLYKIVQHDEDQIVYVNKNKIASFTYSKKSNRECLSLRFDHIKFQGHIFPKEYDVCNEDNPVAFHELFKGLPEKLPKYDNPLS